MTTFKVKEVSKYISNVLRRDSFLSNISVEGEVSNFKNRVVIVILVSKMMKLCLNV